jgi:hypothetical protein
VKLTPVTDAPLIVTDLVDGVNAYPDLLGATIYDPFGRLANVNCPKLFVVVVPATGPDKVTVAAETPLTVPEMLYVLELGGGVLLDALNTTSTQ